MNYYEKAFGIMERFKGNPQRLLNEIFKKNPAAIIAAEERLADPTGMNKEILNFWKQDKKISAIKYCREVSGLGLREAKDYCEKIAKENGLGVSASN